MKQVRLCERGRTVGGGGGGGGKQVLTKLI